VLSAYQEQRHAAPEQNIIKQVRNVPANYKVYISQQGEEKTVWVKEGDNIQERTIHIGTSDGVVVQVLDGLREGDEVVLSMNVVSAQPTAENEATSESPFMPKPPGSKKK
jgi:HlyD family secretion protein